MIDSQIIRVPSTPIAVEHPAQETYAKKGPLDGVTRSRERKEKTLPKPYGPDGNYTTTRANKTINTLQQLEGTRKISRILRTDHHDPRPSGILTRTISKSRRSAKRIFSGVFRLSSIMTVVGSLTFPPTRYKSFGSWSQSPPRTNAES